MSTSRKPQQDTFRDEEGLPPIRLSQCAAGLLRAACIIVFWAARSVLCVAIATLRVRSPGGGWLQQFPGLLERLGPAYVKFAQLASTREDVLPPRLCRTLARLCEDGRGLPKVWLLRVLEDLGFTADGRPLESRLVGSGSVAVVYRIDHPELGPVAVKILRPGVRRAMARDLALLRAGARVLAEVPRFRHLPVVDMVDHICRYVALQSDLRREARNLALLRAHLGSDRVIVPQPFSATWHALVMEYLPVFEGPRRDQDTELDRSAAAHALVRSVFIMLFSIGVVHCDLHPGNIAVAADGELCLVDAGFVVSTDPKLRRQFCEFFMGLTTGNGVRFAQSVISAAAGIHENFDRSSFTAELSKIVERYTNRRAREFSIAAFVNDLFALQRKHKIFVSAAFVVPILTLLVIEGTVRSWAPDMDFQAIAQPIVLGALVRLPRHDHR